MIILPAHSTSKYQPLDVGIYSSYKDNFRRYYRGKGGLYNLLFSSINAFQCSFIPTKIQDAWEASHILDENINEYLNTLKDSEWKNRVPLPTMQIIFVLVVIIITYGILDLLSNNVVYSMNCMLLIQTTQQNCKFSGRIRSTFIIIIEWWEDKIAGGTSGEVYIPTTNIFTQNKQLQVIGETQSGIWHSKITSQT